MHTLIFNTVNVNLFRIYIGQAHVRGYQVRKHYKVIWAVGILDKVVLRWRRKGAGLRGFRQEMDIHEDEDEDILKVFRKQRVDVEIEKAVSRVLSMVDSPDARDQYHRMLEKYRQAKVNKFKNDTVKCLPFIRVVTISLESLSLPLYENFRHCIA